MYPPSITMSAPVVKLEASDARYKYAPASSLGSPFRPMGVLACHNFLISSSTSLIISVTMYPGEMVLTRAKRTHSTASERPTMISIQCPNRSNQVQQPTQVYHGGLRSIVRRLELRDIHNMPTHGSRGN